MTESSSSLERIVPEQLRADEATGADTLKLHMARYEFAQSKLAPGTVLDMACGVGYGTAILASSSSISHATGVDISTDAVAYALQHYQNARTNFICSPALAFNPDSGFDNVVSLETIEHVDNPALLFSHLAALLEPRGRLIASVPITPSVDANPHHKANFSAKSFRQLGSSNGLEYLDSLCQIQRFNPFAVLTRREHRTRDLRANVLGFYWHNPSHLALRLASILKDGFTNKYLTVVWEKPS